MSGAHTYVVKLRRVGIIVIAAGIVLNYVLPTVFIAITTALYNTPILSQVIYVIGVAANQAVIPIGAAFLAASLIVQGLIIHGFSLVAPPDLTAIERSEATRRGATRRGSERRDAEWRGRLNTEKRDDPEGKPGSAAE